MYLLCFCESFRSKEENNYLYLHMRLCSPHQTTLASSYFMCYDGQGFIAIFHSCDLETGSVS